MTDVTLPSFWSDSSLRHGFLSRIRSTMTRMERIHRRKGRDPVAELRASDHAASIADQRYREATNALVRAEREAIASNIERTYPDIGAEIAAAIRSRPDLLEEEAA